MPTSLRIESDNLKAERAIDFAFNRERYSFLEIAPATQEKIKSCYQRFLPLFEKRLPIYGVTTGFGDSSFRSIGPEQSEQLQKNLVAYLMCGTGDYFPVQASRAIFLARLNSLAQAYSAVSPELIERMKLFLDLDIMPVIPQEGSLGASGDLIPLAYLADCLQGQGEVYYQGKIRVTSEVLTELKLPDYKLKPKEGLALVNGTSAMVGICLLNIQKAQTLVDLSLMATSWLVLALEGRTEAFGVLVNEKAKKFPGQARAAQIIRGFLQDENYQTLPLSQIAVEKNQLQKPVQDKYSLRCTPQVLGPVIETLWKVADWTELELNSVSDNPLLDENNELQMGGNFYGGYLGHGMDYLKICLANLADLVDRQLMTVIDEKSNRGLTPNLVAWNTLPEADKFLHHGLKGLNQSVSAITSEIMAKAMPNTIFSRSSESHNQDKVSLGMSAAVQTSQMIPQLYNVLAMHLVCLAQALDLRGVKLKGQKAQQVYQAVRAAVPFVSGDQRLDGGIRKLQKTLVEWSEQGFSLGVKNHDQA